MAHSITYDGAMLLDMASVVRPFAEMLARVGIPKENGAWFEERLGDLAKSLRRIDAVMRKHINSIESYAPDIHSSIVRGCRSEEIRLGAQLAITSFDIVADLAPMASDLIKSIDQVIEAASKARINVSGLAEARDVTSGSARLALEVVSQRQVERDELDEILKAFDAVGLDGRSEEFTFDNWRVLDREMSALRARARETGQAVSWGEPLLDD